MGQEVSIESKYEQVLLGLWQRREGDNVDFCLFLVGKRYVHVNVVCTHMHIYMEARGQP